jgi:thiol-disulfide isomerase/thioredoxin
MRTLTAAVLSMLGALSARANELPASGADLLHAAAKPWQLAEWHGSAPLSLERLAGRVVVVRFWTDTCPYCARSLPALQQLAGEFGDRPVSFVAVYHSKPRGSERAWKDAVEKARELGITFPLAYDRGWKTVDSWWLRGRERVATSPTFVIDTAGRIAYVHPGPEFHPSADADHQDCDRDFRTLRQAIQEALAPANAGR